MGDVESGYQRDDGLDSGGGDVGGCAERPQQFKRAGVRGHQHGWWTKLFLANNTPATLTSIADFNRNGLVNVTDVALAKLNNRHSIPLFTAPAPPPKPPAPAVARAASAVGAAVFSTRVIPPSLKVEKPARKNKDMLA